MSWIGTLCTSPWLSLAYNHSAISASPETVKGNKYVNSEYKQLHCVLLMPRHNIYLSTFLSPRIATTSTNGNGLNF